MEARDINIANKIKEDLLQNTTSLDTLVSHHNNHSDEYYSIVNYFIDTKTELHTSIFSKILAISLQFNEKQMSIKLLNSELYKFSEILRACVILDTRREIAQLKEKFKRLEDSTKKTDITRRINNLMMSCNPNLGFSLTRSKIKIIVDNWVKQIPAKTLEFYALSYDLTPWKELTNLQKKVISNLSGFWNMHTEKMRQLHQLYTPAKT